MDTKQVGEKLVELCREGRNMEAIETLYSADIVSIEAMGSEEMPAEMSGLAAIKGKNEWWYANHEVHSGSTEGPFPHGDRFAVKFQYDVTAKSGPMEGQRFTMEEVGLYTVKDGKIVKEEFFYSM
jgi:hypothetical protein